MAVGKCVKKCAHYACIAIVLKFVSVFFPDTAFYYFTCTANFILYVTLATITYNFFKHLYNDERVEADKKAVFITGCDSGFGNRLATKLDSEGFQVFASCLFPEGEGARQLKQRCSDRLHVLYLDVTKDETVEKALQFVKKNLGSNGDEWMSKISWLMFGGVQEPTVLTTLASNEGMRVSTIFWAVVNNAGITKGFSTDFTSIDDFKDTIDVNALGTVRVTKTFLPLLKKFKGRVVNVTSLVARLSASETCAYTMSKRAALAFTEILSIEMNVWGVRAISIEPEQFRTSITDPELVLKRMEVERKKMPTDILSSYGEEYLEKIKKLTAKMTDMGCSDIDIVVDAIVTAITQKCPDHVYKPRRNMFVRFICFILQTIPFEKYEQLFLIFMKIIGSPVPKDVINSKKRNF